MEQIQQYDEILFNHPEYGEQTGNVIWTNGREIDVKYFYRGIKSSKTIKRNDVIKLVYRDELKGF